MKRTHPASRRIAFRGTLALLAASALGHAQGQRYTEIELVHDGVEYYVGPLNQDGSIMLVGRGLQPFGIGRWTEAGGIEPLEVLQAFEGRVLASMNGISSDGSTIVGTYAVSIEPPRVGVFVWTPTSVSTHQVPPPYDGFELDWVSSNSRYIVGAATKAGTTGFEIYDPVVWDLNTPVPMMLAVPDTGAPIADFPQPRTVSNEGVVAGDLFRTNSSPAFQYSVPARWASGQDPEELGVLGIDAYQGVSYGWGSVRAVTPDGAWMVGSGAIELASGVIRSGAIRWDEQGVPQSLGMVDPFFEDDETSTALAVSDDGSVIVGTFRQPDFPGSYRQYFVWTEQDGIRDLAQLVYDETGVDLSGYEAFGGVFLSGDGRVISAIVHSRDLLPRERSFVFEMTTPCIADTNGDGTLSPNDFNAWILAFNNQDPACDQNGDGDCRQNDFNAWILNFNAGC
ncbi:MAG: GC-type dockerin domain-anchored protein [Planctomycetota bacterium]